MRSFLDSLGRALFAFGILVLLFTLHQLYATDLAQGWQQRSLKSAFERLVGSGTGPSTGEVPAPVPAPLREGHSVAILQIPKIGLEQAVVEGVDVSDLKRGPGHYPETPLPGRAGNAAIAGHRTTYGAPFLRLDELSVGDEVRVTTLDGSFRYVVRQVAVVSPSQTGVLAPAPDNRLTLTTCHPRFSASRRLVVIAGLVGSPVATAPAGERGRPAEPAAGLSGARQSRLPVLQWGAACLLAYAGLSRLARRWSGAAVAVLGAPPFLALLWAFFESLARVLPANI